MCLLNNLFIYLSIYLSIYALYIHISIHPSIFYLPNHASNQVKCKLYLDISYCPFSIEFQNKKNIFIYRSKGTLDIVWCRLPPWILGIIGNTSASCMERFKIGFCNLLYRLSLLTSKSICTRECSALFLYVFLLSSLFYLHKSYRMSFCLFQKISLTATSIVLFYHFFNTIFI